jgi:6-pyruvoyl-tetrahydropterin synthase
MSKHYATLEAFKEQVYRWVYELTMMDREASRAVVNDFDHVELNEWWENGKPALEAAEVILSQYKTT